MSHNLRPVDHNAPIPAPTPSTITLAPGIHLRFLPTVPADAAGRRMALMNSSLYAIVGRRVDIAGNFLGGYIGRSEALHASRAGTSWTHWVIAQKAIQPSAMALLHLNEPLAKDSMLVIESRVIQRLSTDLGMLALTNTHTSAEKAAARLTTADLHTAVSLADKIGFHIWKTALACRTNPWPAPAPNDREATVRIILRASNLERRALDTAEVVDRLNASGYTSDAKTRWRSVRRNIRFRERDTLSPRVSAIEHRHRVLYHAVTLPASEAIRGYDLAHPRPGTPTPRHTRQ